MKRLLISLFSIIILCLATQNVSAHWTTKGPYGGHVTCLYAADTLLYLGSSSGGVYRSTSSTANAWRYANYTGLDNGFAGDIVQVGTSMLVATDHGIFRSADIGATWTLSNTGMTDFPVKFVYTGMRTLVSTSSGIFKSDDGGNTWSFITGSPIDARDLVWDGTTIFVGTMGTGGSGVHMSTNNGDTWTAANTGLTTSNIYGLTLSGGKLFAAGGGLGIYSTSTGTISWSAFNTAFPSSVGINALTASGGTVYAATTDGVYTTPDVSAAWTAANTGFTGEASAIKVFNGKIYIGTVSDGVYKSNSLTSLNWVSHNNGFNNLGTYAVYNDGLLVIAATEKGLFVSRDLAASYVSANNGLTDSTNITAITFAGPDLYVSTQNAGVFKSTDTGQTWTPVNTGLTTMYGTRIHATTTHLIVATGTDEVFTTPISSINWTQASLPPVTVLSITSEGSMHVFLAAFGDGIYTTNDLVTWTNVNPGLTSADVTSVAIHGSDVYAGTMASGIFKSDKNTLSWSQVNTGLPSLDVTALHAAGQWVVAGSKGNVYATYNNGATWEPTNVMDYLPEFALIYNISFTTASTRIFVASMTNSLYSNSVAELPVGISEIYNEVLFNINPNPSNGNFTVTLKDMNESIEGITVLNLDGKEVVNISSTRRSVNMNVSLTLAKGLYLVKVNTSNGVHTQKLVIE